MGPQHSDEFSPETLPRHVLIMRPPFGCQAEVMMTDQFRNQRRLPSYLSLASATPAIRPRRIHNDSAAAPDGRGDAQYPAAVWMVGLRSCSRWALGLRLLSGRPAGGLLNSIGPAPAESREKNFVRARGLERRKEEEAGDRENGAEAPTRVVDSDVYVDARAELVTRIGG